MKSKKNIGKKEEWNPYKSKWKAVLEKGININLEGNENILYLGASSGTTVRHISQMTNGIIFAIENSPKMAIRLVRTALKKNNIAPVFCNARDIEFIKSSVFGEKISVLFQDIPSIDQVKILENASRIVEDKCLILFCLKTQSISQEKPEKTCQEVKEKLRDKFKILNIVNLEPFHKKHYFFVMCKK